MIKEIIFKYFISTLESFENLHRKKEIIPSTEKVTLKKHLMTVLIPPLSCSLFFGDFLFIFIQLMYLNGVYLT
jgi:hypothetical protein